MAKIDPFQNRRLRPIIETRTFSDPAQPGKTIELTLSSKPGSSTQFNIQSMADALAERLMGPNVVGVHVDHEQVPVTRSLCYVIAGIMTLDVSPPQEKYAADEWVAISATMPDAFDAITQWAGELMGQYEKEETPDGSIPLPNGSAAASVA